MCAKHTAKKNNIWLSTPVLYTVMILLGVVSGMSDIGILKTLFISAISIGPDCVLLLLLLLPFFACFIISSTNCITLLIVK